MKKLYLINNPCTFQGENKLLSNSNYFEGWYFKHVGKNTNISIIPSISITNKKQFCYIQIITKNNSHNIPYNIKDFSFSHNPFSIKIANNYFSESQVHLDISYSNINIEGNLIYKNPIKLKKTIFSPNIMGPFSYIPFMECNHAILDLKHDIYGSLSINNTLYDFNNGIGYIEKDWGISFPSSYIWAQSNTFKYNKDANIFISIADIPLKLFNFTGFICVFCLNGKEYKFTTYNGSKIEKYEVKNNNINIILKRKKQKLYINSNNKNSSKLLAPKLGSMNTYIFESVDSSLDIILEENNEVIFKDTSINSGLEIVT